MAWRQRYPSLKPNSTASELCDLSHVTQPLCCIASPIKLSWLICKIELILRTLQEELWKEDYIMPVKGLVQYLAHSESSMYGCCLVAQLCLTLCDPMEPCPPGSSLSMAFLRQEYWSGLSFPSPGDLPNPGIEARSPALRVEYFTSEPPGKPSLYGSNH